MESGINESTPSNSGSECFSQSPETSLVSEESNGVTSEVSPGDLRQSIELVRAVPDIEDNVSPMFALFGDENMTQRQKLPSTIDSVNSSELGEMSTSSS